MLVIDEYIKEETHKEAIDAYDKKMKAIGVICISLLLLGIVACLINLGIFNASNYKLVDASEEAIKEMNVQSSISIIVPISCILVELCLCIYSAFAKKPLSVEATKINKMYNKSGGHINLLCAGKDGYFLHYVFLEDNIVKTLSVKTKIERVDGDISTIKEIKKGEVLLMLSNNVELRNEGTITL